MSYYIIKGEIDIGIRLHSRTWTSFFFPDGFVVLFLNTDSFVMLFCLNKQRRKSPVFGVSLS